MPDQNQDFPFEEKPRPPWQADEGAETEEKKPDPQLAADFSPPVVEEVKEEIDLTTISEKKPVEDEAVKETPVAETPSAAPASAVPASTEASLPILPPPGAPALGGLDPAKPEQASGETVLPDEPVRPLPAPSGSTQAFHSEKKSPLKAIGKILFLFLGLALVAGLVFVIIKFALPRFQEPEEITLTYWGLWEPKSVMDQVIADWNEDNPKIKIDYSMQSVKQYRERIQSALARDEGADIFRYHISWLPMLKSHLSSVPSEVMSASQFESTFYPVASRNLRSGASYLGIPLEIDTLALFYNKTIFQAAGKTPPATWDELRELAVELTTVDESGRIQIAGAALGTTNNVDHWSDILGLMMLQNEADLANPTTPNAEDALTYYTIFNKTDQVWDNTLPNSTLAFANGKLAMYFGFSWDVFEIKRINENLEFGIVKAPQLTGTNISWASFWVEGVNNESEYEEEAWEFLEYLSSEEVLTKLYEEESKLRLFGEPYSRIDMADQAKTNPLVSPFIEQAPQAQTWYLCSRTFDNGINDKMIDYFKDAVNAVNLNKEPEEALETAASGVSQLLSQYGIATIMTR
jgi:multiple sugar transport system substrate-binding protein